MIIEKLKSQVKENVIPYSFFWNEWTANGSCNLEPDEVRLINACVEGEIRKGLIKSLSSFEVVEILKRILRKLELGYQVFKDFVIVNFLQTIINLGKSYGYDAFLSTPIRDLSIDADLKSCLLKLKAHTLQIAFIIYKAEDFNQRWVYEIIVEFQSVFKAKTLLSIQNKSFMR